MRHRITVLNPDAKQDIIESIDKTAVKFKDLPFAREDKFTVDFAFDHIRALRIHYGHYNSQVFNYYTNSNLNIYAQPATDDKEAFHKELGQFLTTYLGLDDVADQFIVSRNSLFLHLRSFDKQAFEARLSEVLDEEIDSEALDLAYADSKLVVSLINTKRGPIEYTGSYKEVGIFNIDDKSEPDDLILSGIRVILNDDDHVQKTLFHVAPKHRHTDQKALTSVLSNGLHPKLVTQLDVAPPHGSCELYYYLTLDKSLFIDKYNLGDPDLILNFGNQDMELPEYKISEWGNEILLQVPKDKYNSTVELNLHSRYQLPNHTQVTIESPVVFFGCDENSKVSLIEYNPFVSKSSIGGNFEAFFTNNTSFYRLDHPQQYDIAIPALEASESINTFTIAALILGLLIISVQVLRPSRHKAKKE